MGEEGGFSAARRKPPAKPRAWNREKQDTCDQLLRQIAAKRLTIVDAIEVIAVACSVRRQDAHAWLRYRRHERKLEQAEEDARLERERAASMRANEELMRRIREWRQNGRMMPGTCVKLPKDPSRYR